MLKACYQHEWIEAGCDEAGRGPLAGPVTAAAVILPPGWNHPLLNDSKKMSREKPQSAPNSHRTGSSRMGSRNGNARRNRPD